MLYLRLCMFKKRGKNKRRGTTKKAFPLEGKVSSGAWRMRGYTNVFVSRTGYRSKFDQSQWLFPLLPSMHTRAIASQRAINDRWRSAGWESLILPGLTATWGDREGGRKLFPRTLSELCSGSSEGTKGFLAPLPVSLLVQFFSSKREKVHKGRWMMK